MPDDFRSGFATAARIHAEDNGLNRIVVNRLVDSFNEAQTADLARARIAINNATGCCDDGDLGIGVGLCEAHLLGKVGLVAYAGIACLVLFAANEVNQVIAHFLLGDELIYEAHLECHLTKVSITLLKYRFHVGEVLIDRPRFKRSRCLYAGCIGAPPCRKVFKSCFLVLE